MKEMLGHFFCAFFGIALLRLNWSEFRIFNDFEQAERMTSWVLIALLKHRLWNYFLDLQSIEFFSWFPMILRINL